MSDVGTLSYQSFPRKKRRLRWDWLPIAVSTLSLILVSVAPFWPAGLFAILPGWVPIVAYFAGPVIAVAGMFLAVSRLSLGQTSGVQEILGVLMCLGSLAVFGFEVIWVLNHLSC